MHITIINVLFLSSCVFAIGMLGVFLNKRNLIVILMSIELILLAANINFVAFSYFLNNMLGHIFVLFSLTVAAAESAIGLALLIVLFRTRRTIDMEELNQLKG